jgi:hypothetical protein
MAIEMADDVSMGRRGLIPAEVARKLAKLSPHERRRELQRLTEKYGEDVELTDDGWTPYGPHIKREDPADAE